MSRITVLLSVFPTILRIFMEIRGPGLLETGKAIHPVNQAVLRDQEADRAFSADSLFLRRICKN